MDFSRFVKRLYRDTRGQVLLFAAVLVVVILAFLLLIPNGTQVTTQKVRSQTAADAGAFTGSVWLARALNLDANMNIGIRSVYTWMTVLTVGEALARALYSDTLDPTVKKMGSDITTALFGSSNPVTVHTNEYPISISKLDTTAQWLYSLQDDIGASFAQVAAAQGTNEACLNINGSTTSQAAGGWALVRTNDTVPLLQTSAKGDSLMYANVGGLQSSLQKIPTGDPNIGPATGLIIVNPNSYNVWAYYSDTSQWFNRVDSFYHCYQKPIIQVFQHGSIIDSGCEYFDKPGSGSYTSYLHGDSWDEWVDVCNEPSHVHTPFIWPNIKPNPPYKNTAFWTLVGGKGHPGNNRYKFDTCWTRIHLAKSTDTSSLRNKVDSAESVWLVNHGDTIRDHYWISTGFYTGAESTIGHKDTVKVRPRQVNPGREFHTVSYVWKNGATSSPYGLGPPMGGTLFPRGRVAATSPLLTVARAVPFMAPGTTDSFFLPAWDAKLTALDSIGVSDITSDSAYPNHSQNSFNLEDSRKYVLLP